MNPVKVSLFPLEAMLFDEQIDSRLRCSSYPVLLAGWYSMSL